MYFILQPHQQTDHPDLIAQMFRLRKKVFGDELRWVETFGPEERDAYDDMNPVYLMHTDPAGAYLYSVVRMMPMSGPTLLSDVFSETIPDAAGFIDPSIWEFTRFCMDDDLLRRHGRGSECMQILKMMNTGSLEFGVDAGIEAYVANFDRLRWRMWRRIGKPFDIVGKSDDFGVEVLLGISECSGAVRDRMYAHLGIQGPVLSEPPRAAMVEEMHRDAA
ncbi:acyl-homoserine-lactone synthase [Acuticoccus sp.]|uniref:acyl-homoserine-lactone synthase n=1 Tax=Acuticoccus sp. TaxID=1904378 RepID=UPI003B52C2C5